MPEPDSGNAGSVRLFVPPRERVVENQTGLELICRFAARHRPSQRKVQAHAIGVTLILSTDCDIERMTLIGDCRIIWKLERETFMRRRKKSLFWFCVVWNKPQMANALFRWLIGGKDWYGGIANVATTQIFDYWRDKNHRWLFEHLFDVETTLWCCTLRAASWCAPFRAAPLAALTRNGRDARLGQCTKTLRVFSISCFGLAQ